MRDIMISHTVGGLDIICRHCGNAETLKTFYFKHFRLEGTGKQSATLRCLACQTGMDVPLDQLGPQYLDTAC
ncbi:hypothetical protein ACGLWX_09025 [Halomonas sp. HMF6819]|uniref:hypothetical protein n=1 Tax=unclassified Halomonas TaxID=2609666 RepID=UPI0020766A3F|nr:MULTISPECIES: hypothetical protein [unclassified Halomonas]